MDYYEGETLKDRLARGPLSTEEAIDVVTQVARGLEEAHRRGIVHRDIKPANVVITDQGVAKILDFGLAKLGGETKLTKTGSTVGTAAYMSPEQVRGDELDQRSDIFSLGVVFHELLTGVSPFSAEHEPAVMHKILNVAPPSLRTSGVKHAVQLEPVVGRMLAKGGRYTRLAMSLPI
jgi:serine/threonine protein kinase